MQRAFDDLSKASARDLPSAFKKYSIAVSAQEKSLQHFSKRSEGVRREIKAFQDIVAQTTAVNCHNSAGPGTSRLGL